MLSVLIPILTSEILAFVITTLTALLHEFVITVGLIPHNHNPIPVTNTRDTIALLLTLAA